MNKKQDRAHLSNAAKFLSEHRVNGTSNCTLFTWSKVVIFPKFIQRKKYRYFHLSLKVMIKKKKSLLFLRRGYFLYSGIFWMALYRSPESSRESILVQFQSRVPQHDYKSMFCAFYFCLNYDLNDVRLVLCSILFSSVLKSTISCISIHLHGQMYQK